MSLQGLAHGASLPLFTLLQKVEGKTALEAVNETRNGIECLELDCHMQVVIMFDGSAIRINIEPLSEFGELVLEELKARSEFPPCEPGTCEVDSNGFCKWCGHTLRV